ncbi:MAG: hypothetical protein KGN01_07505 [Patescibacteria group bacterium]|nr:hypothetical protein [Patescibacteria group bacterium]
MDSQYSRVGSHRFSSGIKKGSKEIRPDPPRDAPDSYNPNGGYQGWTNWDTWNTKLILDNDEQLYKQQLAWKKNWEEKKKRGDFDENMARYAVLKYLVPLARKQDPEIDPSKVNTAEIVKSILDEEMG